MKSSRFLLSALAVFALLAGCDNDDTSIDEGTVDNSCKEKQVKCDNSCINPLINPNYCGADAQCKNFTKCSDKQKCVEGKCTETPCDANQHLSGEECEDDSIENCGQHGLACASEISGWAEGTCEESVCKVSKCQDDLELKDNACVQKSQEEQKTDDCSKCKDQISNWEEGTCENDVCTPTKCSGDSHPHENTCEANSVDNCGEHGKSCADTISGWKNGACTDGACVVSECDSTTSHVFEGKCEDNTPEHCGSHENNCTTTIQGWATGTCEGNVCTLSTCMTSFHRTNDGKCQADTKECCGTDCITCLPGQVCSSGECKSSCDDNQTACSSGCVDIQSNPLNCGKCDNPCTEEGASCKSGQCVVEGEGEGGNDVECGANQHANAEGKCVADSVSKCGSDDNNCAQQPGWLQGSCNKGKCQVTKCSDGYHVYMSGSGNKCEEDTVQNCGKHNVKCKDKETCSFEQKCIGEATCGGTKVDLATNIDHCNACNNKCQDGLTCVKGQCVVANGQAHCGEKIVQLGSIDNCGRCNDVCSDGKLCSKNKCIDGLGDVYCSKEVVDTSSDIDNCGKCGTKCGEGKTCVSGECVDGIGITYCSGKKVNTSEDASHCGSCTKQCGTQQICTNGECKGGSDAICNGYKVSLMKDSANCGKCGNICPKGQRCSNGSCSSGSGNAVCNGKTTDLTGPDHCGKCSNQCTNGKECKNGDCADGDGNGLTMCGDVVTKLVYDSANCGQCGTVCDAGNICFTGTCMTFNTALGMYATLAAAVAPAGMLPIASNQANCNGIITNYLTDNANCGECGNSCANSEICTEGACAPNTESKKVYCDSSAVCKDSEILASVITYCDPKNPLYSRIPANFKLWCTVWDEIPCSTDTYDLSSDNNNCGTCGHACAEGKICHQGYCRKESTL